MELFLIELGECQPGLTTSLDTGLVVELEALVDENSES
jgi:hypothetical protein